MKKREIIKLSPKDIGNIVVKTLKEAEAEKQPETRSAMPTTRRVVTETKKPKRIVRLTESEMVEFIENVTKKIQRSRSRRRN